MPTAARTLTDTDVGERIAALAGGQWHPSSHRDPAETADLSGHVHLDGVWVYLGMGTSDSGGAWLQVAYLYTVPSRYSPLDDTSACGQGAGTRVVEAMRAWVQQTGIPLRICEIENPRFFERFAWSENAIASTMECWQYPKPPAAPAT